MRKEKHQKALRSGLLEIENPRHRCPSWETLEIPAYATLQSIFEDRKEPSADLSGAHLPCHRSATRKLGDTARAENWRNAKGVSSGHLGILPRLQPLWGCSFVIPPIFAPKAPTRDMRGYFNSLFGLRHSNQEFSEFDKVHFPFARHLRTPALSLSSSCASLMIRRILVRAVRQIAFELLPLVSSKELIAVARGAWRRRPTAAIEEVCQARFRTRERPAVGPFLAPLDGGLALRAGASTQFPAGFPKGADPGWLFWPMLFVVATGSTAAGSDRGRARSMWWWSSAMGSGRTRLTRRIPRSCINSKEGVFSRIIIQSTQHPPGERHAIATGVYPNRSGIIANREYRPQIAPSGVRTESIDASMPVTAWRQIFGRGDRRGNCQAAGLRAVIAGAKPVALLQSPGHRDKRRSPRSGQFSQENDSGGNAAANHPRLGAFPAISPSQLRGGYPDGENAHRIHLKNGVPEYTLLWLSDPDYSQHNSTPGSPTASRRSELRRHLVALAQGARSQERHRDHRSFRGLRSWILNDFKLHRCRGCSFPSRLQNIPEIHRAAERRRHPGGQSRRKHRPLRDWA